MLNISINQKNKYRINKNGRKIYLRIDCGKQYEWILPPINEWKCGLNLPYGIEAAINKSGKIYFIE